jgi:hypothetical protein
MRVKLQLVLGNNDGQDDTVTDVVTLQKDHRRIEHLGLTLAEGKQVLNATQHRVLVLARLRHPTQRGAHLLLQTRVKTLNRELGSIFKRRCSDLEVEEIPDAA